MPWLLLLLAISWLGRYDGSPTTVFSLTLVATHRIGEWRDLLAALRGTPLTSDEQAAERLLSGCHYSMDQTSAAASVWWTFWADYLAAVFQPFRSQPGSHLVIPLST